MLSNQPRSLQQRQQRHRRQNSTPTAFDAAKVPALTTIRHGSHRRGMSLDQRRQHMIAQQDQVGMTNPGFSNPQYFLREAQQQRPRPGQSIQYDIGRDGYPISPQSSPYRAQFDAGCPPYAGPVNPIHQVNSASQHGMIGGPDFPFDEALAQPQFLDLPANFNSQVPQGWRQVMARPPSAGRRVSNGIADRVAKFEHMGAEIPRMLTPPSQEAASFYPMTPGATPQKPVPQRFLDSYDTSMEETIKPVRSRSNPRTKSIFDEMREKADHQAMPSPPATVPLPDRSTFDSAPIPSPDFLNLANLNIDFARAEGNYKTVGSPELSSPELHDLPLSPNMETRPRPLLPNGPISTPSSPTRQKRMPSFSSLNIEESITETGITGDDIAAFIDGPDPVDNKWVCLYPECGKKFGRKENIKSHVQTHLGDRQYQCSFCKKCFVRQHDLKRHAKIHSGIKPYPCLCGNSFARHDALTRHRQRGMCIGAFEGIVKKVAKRGRPRKHRPDDESRIDKANRTRSKNHAMSSASSSSGYSSSADSPPVDPHILDDMADFDFSQSSSTSSTAHSPAPTDGVSPQAIQSALSPSQVSTRSHRSTHRDSIASLSDHLTSHPTTPERSTASVYNTPPELCLSSSPPPSGRYFDLDLPSHDDPLAGLANMSSHDDAMFLDTFPGPHNMTQLEQNPDLLLMGKYDDAFCSVGEVDHALFREDGEGDVFFGSP